MGQSITRRDFMRGTAFGALGLAVRPVFTKQKKTTVVLIRHAKVLNKNSKPNANVIQQMLDQAVMALAAKTDPLEAWKVFISPEDILGIKSNVWSYMPTPSELENAIKRRAVEIGIKETNISIDDRGVKNNPVFQKATALINTRPVRTHYWSGIGGCLKNYIPFAKYAPQYHPDSCADLALLWQLPMVKGKTRLNILSALNPLFHGRGAHHFDRRYIWNYHGLIVGVDPVAVDSVGLKLIQAKRLDHFGEERKFETTPKHVMVADEKHHLGTSNWEKINLIKLGWKEGILI